MSNREHSWLVWREKGKGQEEMEEQVLPLLDQLWTALALPILPQSKANPGPLSVRTWYKKAHGKLLPSDCWKLRDRRVSMLARL